jgi:hypothetical protein
VGLLVLGRQVLVMLILVMLLRRRRRHEERRTYPERQLRLGVLGLLGRIVEVLAQ